MHRLPCFEDPRLLRGLAQPDDAGVYQLSEEVALIQTVDFFPPVVDDPFTFGRIAASNALSDVYAMGGRPLTAMNIVCFPSRELPLEVLAEILAGGADAVKEAGAVIVGGHTIEDKEPKYGLAVTGVVHPQRVVTNAGARPGDVLVLTKPLGTGILLTALRGEVLSLPEVQPAIEWMARLNRVGGEVMAEIGVKGCTDITGFGFLGHALEMAVASGWAMEIDAAKVPVLPGAREMAAMGLVPGGAYANRDFCGERVVFAAGVPEEVRDVLFDPQTSGGLLIAASASESEKLLSLFQEKGEEAWVVGRVLERPQPEIVVI